MAAIVEFVAVTQTISKNNNNSSSKGNISSPKNSQLFDIAWTPTQRYDTAIPMLAKLPEFLTIASPCNKIVPIPIIMATPNSP